MTTFEEFDVALGGEVTADRNGKARADASGAVGPDGSAPPSSFRIVTAEAFAAVEEAGTEPLLGAEDEALIPEDGDVMIYGDGGAGKTTLGLDLVCHLAAGDDWLGIPVRDPLRVLVIENEGPRPLFRRKVQRKLASWSGSPLDGRLHLWEEPWAEFTFADPKWRDVLADFVRRNAIDVVVVGPLTAAGMHEAGTLQDVRAFDRLRADVRKLAGRRMTFVIVHHENRGGKVSGAWEGCGDTLLHVRGQGHGRTLLQVQKARWASTYHGKSFQLRWADGEGFELEEKPEFDDEQIAEQIVAFVRAHPGTSWSKVEKDTRGMRDKDRRAVRDQLFGDGVFVNVGKEDGRNVLLDHIPERQQSRLYLADDPTLDQLRPDYGQDGPQLGDLLRPDSGQDGPQSLKTEAAPGGTGGLRPTAPSKGAVGSRPQFQPPGPANRAAAVDDDISAAVDDDIPF